MVCRFHVQEEGVLNLKLKFWSLKKSLGYFDSVMILLREDLLTLVTLKRTFHW